MTLETEFDPQDRRVSKQRAALSQIRMRLKRILFQSGVLAA